MAEKKKGLNLLDFFMLGFGSMVGVGWSVAVNGWMGSGGGVIPAVLGYIFVTLFIIPIGFCYAELTCAMPVAGGVVAYSYKAFGTFPSFLGGWFVALAYVIILPWEAIYINDVLALIFPALKAGEPLYTIAGVGIYGQGLIVGILLSCGLIIVNWRGARLAGKVQTTLTWILAVTGLFVIVFAFLKFNPENLQPIYQNVGKGTHTSMFTGIMAMMVVAPFFLGGFDTIPQAAEEGDSGLNVNNLGKVIVMAVLSAGIFYSLILLSTGGAIPWAEFFEYKRPATSLMFLTLYGGAFGTFMYWASLIGALAGLLTTWNGFFIASARLLMGMARARLIPQFFATVHPKYGTPRGANLFLSIACFAGPFIGMGVIDPLTIAGGVGFVIGWFVTSLSAIKLRSSEPDMLRPYRVPGGKASMGIAAVVSGIVILISFVPGLPSFMGSLAITIFIVWTIIGLVFYAATSNFRKAISEEERIKSIFESSKSNKFVETPQ
ncbi:APC family permease [Sinanaerobacter chloroacetimidivorans]|jgi:APA family basic amino acid/polyamine antiporter|uniref:Amino acid permease n=1 Tax=Sinanaerobacter chloroacetimidivorans TaxID=2818044 RepID=A0A8J8AZV6_9FIRM|nr:APC family permease [Sinanaerobacter chloroacetimidivorans]MBR0596933.1 amino acid permease [Sinanaerobacter chloroacetimidivorans]